MGNDSYTRRNSFETERVYLAYFNSHKFNCPVEVLDFPGHDGISLVPLSGRSRVSLPCSFSHRILLALLSPSVYCKCWCVVNHASHLTPEDHLLFVPCLPHIIRRQPAKTVYRSKIHTSTPGSIHFRNRSDQKDSGLHRDLWQKSTCSTF